MKYSKGITKLDKAKNFLTDFAENPKESVDNVKFYSKIKIRSMNNTSFAKKLERAFLPSNVMIMAVLVLAAYIFILGPSAQPTLSTVVIFVAFSSVCLGVMEWIKRNVTDPKTYNVTSLRLTIITLIVPLMLMQTIGMPQIFVFSVTTLMILSPLMFVIRSKWKISGHMCTFTAMTTIMSLFNGWFAALYILAPVISWSRLKLNAHTVAQVIAGTALGILTPLMFSMAVPLV